MVGNVPSLKRASTSRQVGAEAGLTSKAQHIIRHPWWEQAILTVICANAAWIGFDVDWNDTVSPVPSPVFVVGENVFCFLFTVELLMRFFAYNKKIDFFIESEAWKSNVFDLFLVSLMILEVWILAPLATTAHMNQFMVVRLLRLLRLLRISRIFRMVPELGMMVRNMAQAARSVSSTLILEIGIIYAFAVIFTQWTKSHPNPCFAEFEEEMCFLDEHFGSILKSFVTLMQILVFDDTFAIIRPILKDTSFMGCLLCLFMVVGSWMVLNMLIGIICEIICTGTAEEKMKMLEERVREVFATIDEDGSGTVSRLEFNEAAMAQLVNIGINKDVLKNAFDILDEDGSGSFDLNEFLTMIFKLLNPPQSQDIQVLNGKMNQLVSHFNLQTRFGTSARDKKPDKTIMPEAWQDRMQHPENLYELQVAHKVIRVLSSESQKSPSGRKIDPTVPQEKVSLPLSASGLKESHVSNGMSHPFAPDKGPECISGHLEPLALQSFRENVPTASLDVSQTQAREVYEKLQPLAQSDQQVGESLKLVHGWKAWEISNCPEAPQAPPPKLPGMQSPHSPGSFDSKMAASYLRDAGLNDFPEYVQAEGNPSRPHNGSKDSTSRQQKSPVSSSSSSTLEGIQQKPDVLIQLPKGSHEESPNSKNLQRNGKMSTIMVSSENNVSDLQSGMQSP